MRADIGATTRHEPHASSDANAAILSVVAIVCVSREICAVRNDPTTCAFAL